MIKTISMMILMIITFFCGSRYETLVLEIKDQDAQEIIGYNFK